MSLLTIAPPPGIFRNGTMYQSKGRWYDMNLKRFQEGAVKSVPGWQLRSSASAFVGAVRCTLSWRDNAANRWIGVGSHSNLYVQDEAGANHDITPTGYVVGRADASQNLGYGGGTYGTGFYGTPRTNVSQFLPASVWSLDSWGEDLVGCCDTDGKVYLWTLNVSTKAAVVTNAPTGCVGIVATEEGFLLALGSGGDARRVAWCDQQDITDWTAAATNQAGDFDLVTVGTLMCGKAVPGGALLFTDVDAWLASYIGSPLVYSFQRVGSACGPISKGAIAARDAVAAWMGQGGFWLYDGQNVQPLSCEVADYVFGNLNTTQGSKVTSVHIPNAGELWWFFPSAASNENDSYVVWSYRESLRVGSNVWAIGQLQRLAGTGKGVYPNPLMVDASGFLYEHEVGVNYGSLVPYIECGPIELGNGDNLMEVQKVVPDELISGDLAATLFCRDFPAAAETTHGPYSLGGITDVMFQAGIARVRFTGADDVGLMKLQIVKGDPLTP